MVLALPCVPGLGSPCVLQGIVRGHLSRTEAVVLSFSLKSLGKLRVILCCSSGSYLSSSIKGSYDICFGWGGKEISSKESPLCVKQFASCILFNLHHCKSISKPCVSARKLSCRDEGPSHSHGSVPPNILQAPYYHSYYLLPTYYILTMSCELMAHRSLGQVSW